MNSITTNIKGFLEAVKDLGIYDAVYSDQTYKLPSIIQIGNMLTPYYNKINQMLEDKSNTVDIITDSLEFQHLCVNIEYINYTDIKKFEEDYTKVVENIDVEFCNTCINELFLEVADVYYSYSEYDEEFIEESLTQYVLDKLD